MSFEESLIRHASPTLASIKIACLYSFNFCSMEECIKTLDCFNKLLNQKGIYIELVKHRGDFYLIYVYRKSHLQRTLDDSEIIEFLKKYGYSSELELKNKIDILKKRLCGEDGFPHEIGVFLGYPIDDVKSFIDSKGDNFILCGDWKVYHNVEEARCLFCKYKNCRETYMKIYKAGRKLSDMLVAA